jgi:ATP-binding cassette subfamily A (ABC1) protein 3
MQSLRKVFKNPAGGPDRVAVNCLDMTLYRDQVTVLLGHNGAGKTTAISMLVGLTPPTGGNAMFPGGLSIKKDMQTIRHSLGVCPQHDILFPELTSLQHLQIFAAFKGVSAKSSTEVAYSMLAEVGLSEKAHAMSSTLSGRCHMSLS